MFYGTVLLELFADVFVVSRGYEITHEFKVLNANDMDVGLLLAWQPCRVLRSLAEITFKIHAPVSLRVFFHVMV